MNGKKDMELARMTKRPNKVTARMKIRSGDVRQVYRHSYTFFTPAASSITHTTSPGNTGEAKDVTQAPVFDEMPVSQDFSSKKKQETSIRYQKRHSKVRRKREYATPFASNVPLGEHGHTSGVRP